MCVVISWERIYSTIGMLSTKYGYLCALHPVFERQFFLFVLEIGRLFGLKEADIEAWMAWKVSKKWFKEDFWRLKLHFVMGASINIAVSVIQCYFGSN